MRLLGKVILSPFLCEFLIRKPIYPFGAYLALGKRREPLHPMSMSFVHPRSKGGER